MAKHYAKRRVPFFDLQWEMEHGSYVMDPQYATGSFKEPHYCAIYYQALREGFGNQATPCTIKCDLCRNVCETTDYMRGKSAPHYPVPVKLQTAWYSRIWQTKPNPFHSPRLYWDFIQGHFKLMRWL